MMTGTAIGIFAATLLWLALLVKFTRRWLPSKWLLVVLLMGAVMALVPLNNLLVGGYIFSLTSYLAIPSMLLLLGMLFSSFAGQRCETFQRVWSSQHQWLVVAGFFVIAGFFLYPMTAGLTLFDPYRLGYLGTPGSVMLCAYLLCWALLSIIKRWYLLLALILTSVLAYHFKLLPSLNLWDYVIDPLVFIYSLFTLLASGACWLFNRQRSNQQVF